MAIETYQQRIGVTAGRELTRPQIPAFSSAGGEAIGQLGAAFAEEAYKREMEEVEKAAIRDAGVASIVKDENGQYVRPPAQGGGRAYVEAYDKITRERQANLINRDVQVGLDQLLAEEKKKPNPDVRNFEQFAMARIEGVLDTVEPELRPFLESKLSTEFLERFRYLSGWSVDRNTRIEAQGLEDEGKALVKEIDSLLSEPGLDDADRDTKVATKRADYVSNVEARKALGIINEKSGNAELALLGLDEAKARAAIAENDLYIEKAKPLTKYNADQLEAIIDESDGVENPNAPDGYKFSDLQTLSQTTRNRLATNASTIAARIRRKEAEEAADRRAAEAEARQAARDAANAREIREAVDRVSTGVGELTAAQEGALDVDFENRFPTAEAMRAAFLTPEGQKEILDHIAQYRRLPRRAKAALNALAITEGGGKGMLDLFEGIEGAYTNYGEPVGDLLIKSLDPRARVAYSAMESMARSGESERDMVMMAQTIMTSKLDSLKNIKSGFVDGRGNVIYERVKRDRIAEALGGKAGDYVPQALLTDYDNLIQYQMPANRNNARAAALATAKLVAQGWEKSAIFHGEYGPKYFRTRGVTAADLDQALFGGKGPVSFGNLRGGFRATIEPVSYASEKRFGYVRVHVNGPNGYHRPGRVIDLDKMLDPYLKRRATTPRSRPATVVMPVASSVKPGR